MTPPLGARTDPEVSRGSWRGKHRATGPGPNPIPQVALKAVGAGTTLETGPRRLAGGVPTEEQKDPSKHRLVVHETTAYKVLSTEHWAGDTGAEARAPAQRYLLMPGGRQKPAGP